MTGEPRNGCNWRFETKKELKRSKNEWGLLTLPPMPSLYARGTSLQVHDTFPNKMKKDPT